MDVSPTGVAYPSMYRPTYRAGGGGQIGLVQTLRGGRSSLPSPKNSQPTYSTPWGLNAAGRKLWDTATSDSVWAGHELAILEEACRTRDRIVQLDAAVVRDGVMISSPQGDRVHPAIGESRQQRMALARLLATLSIPPLEEDVLPSARSVRGVYGIHR